MRGYAFSRTADFKTVREIKEKLCYVSYNLDLEPHLSLSEEMTVPTVSTLEDIAGRDAQGTYRLSAQSSTHTNAHLHTPLPSLAHRTHQRPVCRLRRR